MQKSNRWEDHIFRCFAMESLPKQSLAVRVLTVLYYRGLGCACGSIPRCRGFTLLGDTYPQKHLAKFSVEGKSWILVKSSYNFSDLTSKCLPDASSASSPPNASQMKPCLCLVLGSFIFSEATAFRFVI